MNRRDILRLGTASLAGSAISGQEALASPRPFVYASGSSIRTPSGPVYINGWKIEVSPEGLQKYSRRHPDRHLRYSLIVPGAAAVPAIDYGPGESSIPTLNYVGIGTKKWILQGFPSAQSRHSFFNVEENDRNGPVTNVSFSVRFEYYGTDNCSLSHNIFSEAALGEGDFADLCEVGDRFSSFVSPFIRVYVFHRDESTIDRLLGYNSSRNGTADAPGRRVLLSANSFLSPVVPKEGKMVAFHEFSHHIADAMMHDADQEAYRDLSIAYDKLLAANGGFRQAGPGFNVFCESEYFDKSISLSMGHPWDNCTELFASALTVFGFFPQEFLQKVSEKDSVLKNSAKVCLNAVKKTDRDGRRAEELLPAYRQLIAGLA